MRRIAFLLSVVLSFTSIACRSASDSVSIASAPGSPAQRLEKMPRHDEWIEVARGEKKIRTYMVHPERSSLAPVVVLIHENRGLSDWIRSLADQVAARGYLVVVPDFLSGMAPNGGNTRDFVSEDAAREAISRVTREDVLADLKAVINHVGMIPSAARSISVAGFCWGGARAWEAANGIDGLASVHVFYGTGPGEAQQIVGIDAPVYGYYGGEDARVNATIPKSEDLMRAAGRRFEPVIYPGAGHAFMRSGEAADASEANRSARTAAWDQWLKALPE